MTKYDNQGVEVEVPDYQKAFLQDTELGTVISKVGQVLTDLGYSLKDAEQTLKTLRTKAAEDNMTISKTTGAALSESPLDMLKRRLKSDVLIQISWSVNHGGGTFSLEAFDSYTNKRIATSIGTIPSGSNIPDMLQKAVKDNVKAFDKQMDAWYADQIANGREIILTIKRWDNWDKDLETEYNGEELTDCIQDWLRKNTVKGSFNLSDATENFAQFEQVRIPLVDEKGNALDARSFATKIRKMLNQPPYNITCKVMQRGLGEAMIVLGEK